ncbi:MAG: phosphotransferase [Burkholderiaceae bacterium]|jgi:aminoglycoside/choline kinase family phosphotransferase
MLDDLATPPPDGRRAALQTWLGQLDAGFSIDPASLEPASSDASFRRYFRVTTANASESSLIVMDAPPEREDSRPFLKVAALFGKARVSVPEIRAFDLAQGFLLLTDLGRQTYLSVLDTDNADALYRDAFEALRAIQGLDTRGQLPPYDQALLKRELLLFPEWYLARHRAHPATAEEVNTLEGIFKTLIDGAQAQPQVAVHRDFHARNLMFLPEVHARRNPGVLDFQDAVVGPITYDLVSLMRDAYIAWEEERVLDWTIRYWEAARKQGLPVADDFADFWRDFEWMGLQRHLKVLGIFARLAYRDGKTDYLADLPLVLRYTRAVASRYAVFFPLVRLLDRLEPEPPVVGYTF